MGTTTIIDTSASMRVHPFEFTFDREYNVGEFVDICHFPGGARIVDLFINRPLPDPNPDLGEAMPVVDCNVGTPANPTAITQFDPTLVARYGSSGMEARNMWYKEDTDTYLRLTFAMNFETVTERLTGKTIRGMLRYAFAENVTE
jgi:hypothetical protein